MLSVNLMSLSDIKYLYYVHTSLSVIVLYGLQQYLSTYYTVIIDWLHRNIFLTYLLYLNLFWSLRVLKYTKMFQINIYACIIYLELDLYTFYNSHIQLEK